MSFNIVDRRKICIVTGTRAEYGLLRFLMKAIQQSDSFELQIITTGMHLAEKYGNTYKEIEEDGFTIDKKIDIQLQSDTPVSISRSTALGLVGFSEAFDALLPDLVLLLGDRYEILSAAISAMFARIPIAHLHGGERTEGSIDEAIRHAITKCSHLHFVANQEYRSRVIQLGENPSTVFNVGGLGVDSIKRVELLNREELEVSLDFKFKDKNLLITFHPATLDVSGSKVQMSELLKGLADLTDTQLIFTMPNADLDSQILYRMTQDFVCQNKNACVFVSLGQLHYLSCIAQVDAVVGNSSSGLTEAPSFKKATINIGDRQKGRLRAASVINCMPDASHIKNAIDKVYDAGFQSRISNVANPYGEGGAVDNILRILSGKNFVGIVKKDFYDVGRY